MSNKPTTAFETETCSRCHGSGKYSFCERYRDVCFKCAGAGVTYTTRGAMARDRFIELCSEEAAQLQVGDVIRTHGVTRGGGSFRYRAPIVEIKMSESATVEISGGTRKEYRSLAITTLHPKYGKHVSYMAPHHRVRVFRASDEVRLEDALAYQFSLTKAGKARKRKR